MRRNPRLKAFHQAFEHVPTIERSGIESIPRDWKGFNNQAVGPPMHPNTRLPSPLLSYQDDIGSCPYKELLVNKCNKIGVSEAIIREAAWRGTRGDCVGYQMAFGAQDYPLAVRNLRRLRLMFERSDMLRPLVDWNKS